MDYRRMPIEAESPEQFGYERIRSNLAESSVADTPLRELGVELDDLVLMYGDHSAGRGCGRRSPRPRPASPPTTCSSRPAPRRPCSSSTPRSSDRATSSSSSGRTTPRTSRRPRAIGAAVRHLDLRYEDDWIVDPDRIRALLTPRDEARLADDAAQPDRPGHAGGGPARGRRDGRGALGRPAARRRDVPGDDVRRSAAAGGQPVRAGDRRVVAVEVRRAARDPDRLADHDRRRPPGAVPGRQGADPHHELGRRRGDRRGGARPAARAAAADPGRDRDGTADRHGVARRPGAARVGRAARRGRRVPARSARRCRSTSTRSTGSCWTGTARSSGRATGSTSRAGTSGWATAGRRRSALEQGLAAIGAAAEEALERPRPGQGQRAGAAIGNALLEIDRQIFRDTPRVEEMVKAGGETVGLAGDGSLIVRLPASDPPSGPVPARRGRRRLPRTRPRGRAADRRRLSRRAVRRRPGRGPPRRRRPRSRRRRCRAGRPDRRASRRPRGRRSS